MAAAQLKKVKKRVIELLTNSNQQPALPTEEDIEELKDLLRENRKVAAFRLEFPRKYDGSYKCHVLHQVALCSDSLSLVTFVADCYPQAHQAKVTWTKKQARSCLGIYPLHFALLRIHRKCPTEILEYLIEQNPEAVKTEIDVESKRYAIHHLLRMATKKEAVEHSVVSKLVEIFPKALEYRDRHSYLPLHYACANGLPQSILEELVEKAPSTVSSQTLKRPESSLYCKSDATGRSPFSLLCASENTTGTKVIDCLLATYPALKEADDDGMLPIHHAASYHGPRDPAVLNHLLKIWPESIRIPSTKSRQLPIHFMALRGDGLEVLKHMLELFPESVATPDAKGQHPIHTMLNNAWSQRRITVETVKLLVEANPSSLLVQAGEKRFNPLHELCERIWTTERKRFEPILEYLIAKEPESLLQAATGGLLPLHLAINIGKDGWFLEALLEHHNASDQVRAKNEKGQNAIRMQMLAASKWSGDARTKASNAERCRLLLTPYPQGAFDCDNSGAWAFPSFDSEQHLSMVFEDNGGQADTMEKIRMMLYGYVYGNLDKTDSDREILHAVCACPCSKPVFMQYFMKRYGEERRSWQDRDGRYPLHLALESGKLDMETLDPLLDPAVLTARDVKTGLYPFQMAAAAASEELDTLSTTKALNVIFVLLRGCPEAWGRTKPNNSTDLKAERLAKRQKV